MTTSRVTTNWGSLILHGVNPTGKEIGHGAYGRVFEVDYEGTLCAAKEVHALLLQYAQGDDLRKIKDDFLRECQIWSTLRHPCVVQFLGVYYPAMDQHTLPVMVMEKMQHSLRGLVEKYDNIPLNVKLSILDEVCLGLRYLHSRNPPIVHRDLTPNNILLSYRLEAKITDLGVAKVVKSDDQKSMTKLPGTPDFMPPEALSKKPVYGPSLDVFSYGGVILNVTTQLWPQPTDLVEINPNTGRREVVSEVRRRQEYLDKMTGGATDLKPLVTSCLDDNPRNRPPVAEVSMTIKSVKDEKSGHDGISPIVWWAEVSNEQQSQVTSSLTTALEEMNEQLRKENDVLKTDNTQLRTNNDVLKTDNTQLRTNNDVLKTDNTQLRTNNDVLKTDNTQLRTNNDAMKDENKQLTTLLNKMAVNNQNQIQQINFQSSENATMKDKIEQLETEVDMIKAENVQLKIEIDGLRSSHVDTSRSLHPPPVPQRRQQLKDPGSHHPIQKSFTLPLINQIVGTGKNSTSRPPVPPPVAPRPKYKQQPVLKESTTPSDLFSGPVNIKWEGGAPAPVGLHRHTAVWLNGLVYVGGGFETGWGELYVINCYDPVNNSWSSPIITPYCFFAMTTLNDNLLIAGGQYSGKRTNQILTMDAGQLTNYTKMVTARVYATAVGHQGMLIITGGEDDKLKELSSTELFDSSNGQWCVSNDLPRPHTWLKSVIVDNILYLLGGYSKSDASTAVFTAPLDTLSRHQLKWNILQDTPYSASAPVSIHGSHLLIVGGGKMVGKMVGYKYTQTPDVYKLNKISHSWETIGHIPSARNSSAVVSIADNRVIVIGGENKGEFTNTVWIGSCDL